MSDATPTLQISPAQSLFHVYVRFDYDPRSFLTGTYDNLADAQAGLRAQEINGGTLVILQSNVIDRTAG